MIRMVFGAVLLAAAASPAWAEGFSGSGAAGVAQTQGAAASPGGPPSGGAGEASALAPDPGAAPIRGIRRIDTAYAPHAPRRGRPGRTPRPW